MRTEYIFQIAELIARGTKDEEIKNILTTSQTEIQNEIGFLSKDRGKVFELLNILFPEKISANLDFYHKLSMIQYYLGFKPITTSLKGLLWIEAYKHLPKQDAELLLQLLITDKQVDIWLIIHSLPIFLSEIELSPDYASNWFFSIAKKIGADLAGGDFYKAVENYSSNFPRSGLSIFEKYLSEGLDDIRLHLSSILLGAIRASSEKGLIQKQVIQELDKKLVNATRTELRLCYHRSWIITFWRGMLSIKQLEKQLSKMIEGAEEEISEAFNVLYKCLLSQQTNEAFVNFSMQWFNKNASNKIPPLAKYCIVNSMLRLCDISETQKRLVNVSNANKLIITIQPISKEDAGIWSDIEYYLVDRLREDKNLFADFLNQLAETNIVGLLEHFDGDKFGYLKSEMMKSDMSKLIAELLFSTDDKKRRLGGILFQKIKINSFPSEILEKVNESQLIIALWEFVRRPYMGPDTSRFFILLEPRIRVASPEVKKEFELEMLNQAINYPGECLENWKEISDPSDLLKYIIKAAENYFGNFKNTRNSPANSFSFPEFGQAAEKGSRAFSRKVSRDVHEKSIFMKLVKNVSIIYGDQWSIMVQGKLGDATPFKEVFHSMEFPRLEEIDPEGMAIRRYQATPKIMNLQKKNV